MLLIPLKLFIFPLFLRFEFAACYQWSFCRSNFQFIRVLDNGCSSQGKAFLIHFSIYLFFVENLMKWIARFNASYIKDFHNRFLNYCTNEPNVFKLLALKRKYPPTSWVVFSELKLNSCHHFSGITFSYSGLYSLPLRIRLCLHLIRYTSSKTNSFLF